jgi:hypothetical protein
LDGGGHVDDNAEVDARNAHLVLERLENEALCLVQTFALKRPDKFEQLRAHMRRPQAGCRLTLGRKHLRQTHGLVERHAAHVLRILHTQPLTRRSNLCVNRLHFLSDPRREQMV